MQGKDIFFALLGIFILSVTFFFCGGGVVTSPSPVALKNPAPVALKNPAEIPPPAPNIIEPPPSRPPVPPASTPGVVKKKIADLLIGNPITFRINSAILLPEGKTVLNRVATILREDPTAAFEVGGHTDNDGPEHANGALSEQRAKVVVEYLISQGIAAERLTPNGYGASRPIAERATDEGLRHHQRIEFSVVTQGEQP